MSFENTVKDQLQKMKFLQQIDNIRQMGFKLPLLFENLSHGRYTGDTTVDLEVLGSYLEETQPFVFYPEHGEVQDIPDTNTYSDQPFDVVSFEVKDMFLTVPIPEVQDDCWVVNMVSVDKSPEERYILATCLIICANEVGQRVIISRKGDEIWLVMSAMREIFTQKLHTHRHASVDRNTKIRLKTGKSKRKFTINKVIYVADKKTVESGAGKGQGITWSHAWRCRGHWRTMPEGFVGKDRHGERNQNGRTWISDFVKGSGVLVEKVRRKT